MDGSVKRHVAKTITYRIVGTIFTMVVGYVVTGNPFTAVQIGAIEMISKPLLYFIHERVWYRSKFGVKKVRKN
jgi:uncharacterized membrane protein